MRLRTVMAALLCAGVSAAGGAGLAQDNPQAAGRALEERQQADDLTDVRILGEIDPNVRKATALVNGDIITDTDIEQRLNLVIAANGGKIGDEERTRLRLQVLRNLIDEKLQIQEAGAHDVKIEQSEVDSAYARVAANFKQAPGRFEEFLRANGSSPTSIKQQIRGELAWSRLLRKRIEPLVNVGDDEVQRVIKDLEASRGKPEYRVGEIFLSATPETMAQVMADAQRIVAQVRGGASFVAYARQFSESSSAGQGGDLGYVKASQLKAGLEPVITTMRTGTVSDPIPVTGGIEVVALIDKRTVGASDPADAVLSLKQIAIAFTPDTTQPKAQEMVKTVQAATQDMGGCGKADAVAKSLGAEVTTNDNIRIRDLPPALQNIVKGMSIGQATPPFGSSKDGIRVLVLCGRDDPVAEISKPDADRVAADMTDERVNLAARRYLRDLRRDAVIDYR